MRWSTLKAAEWLPDQPDFENPGATVANNCYAGATAYLPIPEPEELSQATPTTAGDYVRGAFSVIDGAGTAHTYAADAGDIYELDTTATWSTISAGGEFSGTGTDEVWRFIEWTPDLIVATNYNNNIRKITPQTATVAELGGSPPRARYIAQIRDFLVLGNVVDGATAYCNRVQWSGFNSAEYWSTGLDMTRQSDYQDLYEGGDIYGLVDVYGMGLVIQEQAVHLMRYVGQSQIFTFDRLTHGVGSQVPGSVIAYRDRAYWWGTSDIWEYAAGQVRPIGGERVARHLFSEFDSTNKGRVTSFADPERNIIVWVYPGRQSVNGVPDTALIYAWNVDRFTSADLSVTTLSEFKTPGYTLDGLDAITTDIDALVPSLDDSAWKGGDRNLGGFNTSNKLVTFSGTPLSATVETPELRPTAGRHFEITNTRPLYEGGTPSVEIGTRALHNNNLNWKMAKGPNAFGECPIRTNARFTRGRLTMSGDWSYVIGLDVFGRQAGTR